MSVFVQARRYTIPKMLDRRSTSDPFMIGGEAIDLVARDT
jgi:hypothetical protein